MKSKYTALKFIIALLLINLIIFSSSVKAQWEQPDTLTFANALGSIGNITLSALQGVGYSTNFGQNWIITNQGLPPATSGNYAQAIFVKNNLVFLGIDPNGTPPGSVGVYKSLDSGKTWQPSATGMLNATPVYSFFQKDELIFAGTDDGVYASSNDGVWWYKASSQLNNKQISSFAIIGNKLIAGIYGSPLFDSLGVFVTTNNGANWSRSNAGFAPTTKVYSMVSLNGAVFATATDGRVYKSTNGAASWFLSSTGITNFYNIVYAINKFRNNLIIGCDDGIFLSTDGGANWTLQITGMRPHSQVQRNSIIQSGNYVFVPANTGIYRRDINQVSVQNISSTVSDKFKLSQNYPNPFNPSTKIRFELPKSSFVSLKVYNSLGREVASLVSEQIHAGIYEETFDASNFSSGVYFYKISAGDFIQTKKMLLVK